MTVIQGANPPTATGSQGAWSAQMKEMQQESQQESLVEMQTNEIINRNNAAAQAAGSVGRT